MIRDPGPIHNLGFSVTSRDIPSNAGETEGDAPNSGYVARALDEHPVMRFFATTAATIAGTVIASRVTRKGGLKLGRYLQDQADNAANLGESTFSTRIVKSALELRRHLDELQGISRYTGDKNPYSELVFKQEGKLLTGYEGKLDERSGFGFLSAKEKRDAGSNFLSDEPAHIWTFKDQLQQQMVRAGRRLPYELPAMYAVQKSIIDPLSGERDESDRKVKWYNPVDVVADFTKVSLTNIATMMLPFEFAGATAAKSRSSLHTLRYSMNDMRRLTPYQQRMRHAADDLSDLLSEVGQDFTTLTNKFLKTSAQSSGALAAAADAYSKQGDFTSNLRSLKNGLQAARDAEYRRKGAAASLKGVTFKTLFTGFDDGAQKYSSIFELSPAFRGLKESVKAGVDEFRLTGTAYDAMESSIAFNKAIAATNKIPYTTDQLKTAIENIQSRHSSRVLSFAQGITVLGRGGPTADSFSQSEFFRRQEADGFKDLLENQLISRGVDAKLARRFTSHARVLKFDSETSPDNIIRVGKSKPFSDGDEFFDEVIKRFHRIRGGKNLARQIDATGLRHSIEDAKSMFISPEYQRNISAKIAKNWGAIERQHIQKLGGGILGSKKARFQDYMDPGESSAKQAFIKNKTAQTVGISLLDEDGYAIADDLLNKRLAERGFDPFNYTDMRAFLIKNRKMTSGITGSGFNIFGLQAVTVDEAMREGRFDYLPTQQKAVISNLARGRSVSDPTSTLNTMSKLDGVYRTQSGDILDFTAVKSTVRRAADFFASEFKIPILGFNPTDLFGYRSFSGMRNKSPIEYISSRDVQPFLGKEKDDLADFYIFTKAKGSKGKLVGFRETEDGRLVSSTVAGTFRSLPTASNDLLTRITRQSSDSEGMTIDEIHAQYGDEGLGRFARAKKRWSVDSEQPNSLVGAAKRFLNRGEDRNNDAVIAKLLRSGAVDADTADKQLLGEVDRFRRRTFRTGMPQEVMSLLETRFPEMFRLLGIKSTEIKTAQDAIRVYDEIKEQLPTLAKQASDAGNDSTELFTAFSRLTDMIIEGNFGAASNLSQYSPTISTRLDEFRNEIFKYMAQANQLKTTGASSNESFVDIIRVVDELHKRGVISAAQKTEAQAAGLSMLFNYSAFKTYSGKVGPGTNAREALKELMRLRSGAEELFDPYAEGTISQISSTMRRRFSFALAPMKKRYGSAGFQPSDIDADPLGSGQLSTIVPTFGTVFGRNPFAATASALGINTYRNADAFSTGSIPMAQGVERLNRYFGSLGGQLDVSDFSGPLSLFGVGMVGKRVLPLYAAGVTALTVDRTLGGIVNEEDARGERVYSPLILGGLARGAVEAQAMGALMPGGMSYQDKREQLLEGEVPIRQGRFWPLGNQPFLGGKTMYYRPSWYRRMQSGAMFTSDTYGSPLEKFLFYNDISPLRPLDPYRFERKHYEDRPYPVTGEYFTGPFGPLVPLANATIGKVLKPTKMMHEEEVAAGLASYAPAGEFGAYDTSAYAMPSRTAIMNSERGIGTPGGFGGSNSGAYAGPISSVNASLSARSAPMNTAQTMVRGDIGNFNSQYVSAANGGFGLRPEFGPPKISGVMNPRIVASGEPLTQGSMQFQASEFGYRTQEMLGIYGFAFGALRQGLGFGQSDLEPQRAVLQSASKAYSSSRAFWDLNLGGLGDIPIPSQEAIGNIEFSEIVRRFIPKERSGIDYLNPIQNTMGRQYNWLPGSEYYIDFTRGDPFTKVQEGELRLPGVAYERLNRLYPDQTGQYGLINQLDILGDVAPYSQQYKSINAQVNKMNLSPDEKLKVAEIRKQVEDVTTRNNFEEYKYRNTSAEEMGMNPYAHSIARFGEYLAHSDNFIITKIAGKRTAAEDWERMNVYGSSFPQWQSPIESYIQPMLNKATQDNPITAAASLGIIGGMFGRTPKAKLFGSVLGTSAGLMASAFGNVSEMITGERYVPKERRKEIALEEYSDIVTYVKNTRLAQEAKTAGDAAAAAQFASAAGRTMYGMDLDRLRSPNRSLDMISLAVPKRKREHFKAMVDAPVEDRERILSTAGRLERRLYQAAWGMEVEQRPDLVDYFSRHELPDDGWEGWLPSTNNDHVKIKMGQSMGLEMSQMGYYPQQIREANLANPSYPTFSMEQDRDDVTDRLRRLMTGMGIRGSVTPVMNPFGSQQINVSAGVG